MTPGSLVAGRFRVERLTAEGGMSSVYRALDVASGAAVAIKVLSGDFRGALDRFEREARLLSEMAHPAIVRLLQHGRLSEDRAYLVLEWLEGETLEQRLARSGLTVGESVAVVARMAEALGVVHALGIVHRDVKPANVFLVGGRVEEAKLIDFGVARAPHPGEGATRTGAAIGTPAYMAPEQARGERNVDARADVFALGCVLFECLTGRPAFPGANAMAVLARILLEPAPPVDSIRSDVPRALVDLTARMLSKDPDQRPRTGAAVAAEISELGTVAPDGPARSSARPPALGSEEQRVLCVLMGRADQADQASVVSAPTVPDADDTLARVAAVATAHGGHTSPVVGNSFLVTITARSGATDQAERGARCALSVREIAKERRLALAMGSGTIDDRWPAGEVIDRAASLLERAGEGRVMIDEVTAGLLDERFVVVADQDGTLALAGEREIDGPVRTLLGRATPYVGRDRELRALTDLFEECADESVARLALVTGPAGSGKSRLGWELWRGVVEQGRADVWIGRGDPMGAGSTFGMLGRALRRAAGMRPGEPVEVLRDDLRALVARRVTQRDVQRITEFLGEITGAPFPDEGRVELAAARRDPVLMGDQIVRACEDLIAASCRARPLMLVLEDAHWGDAGSIKVVTRAIRNLRELPLFVLMLARPGLLDLFPRLGETAMQEVRLGELSHKASERLVREVLPNVGDDVVERIVTQASGNVLYLEELVRAVASGRTDEAPKTVLAMVRVRLEGLEAEARRILRAASIFGATFSRDGVAALLGGAERTTRLGDWLRELVQREVLVRHASAEREQYAFRHALFRDAAYAMLTEHDRELGHSLAGRWLESTGERDAVLLAGHFERGGEPARAVEWYRRAAEHALAEDDLRAAHDLAARGLACGASGAAELALLDVQLDSLDASRSRDERLAIARRVLSHVESAVASGAPPALACSAPVVKAAVAVSMAGDRAPASRIVELLLATELAGDDAASVIRAAAEKLMPELLRHGSYELAAPLLDRLVDVAEKLPSRDPLLEGAVQTAIAWSTLYAGDLVASLRAEELALTAYERAGSRRYACQHLVGVGYQYLVLGEYAEAARFFGEALKDAERIGLEQLRGSAMHNLSFSVGRAGDVEQALVLQRKALEIFEAVGSERSVALCHVYLAWLLVDAGRPEEAEGEALRALERLSGEAAILPAARSVLARARLLLGRIDAALADASTAYQELQRLGSIEDGEQHLLLTYAEALHAAGRTDEARVVIGEARQRLLARAGRISDAALRQSYLSAVSENARTLDLAAKWLGEPT